MLRSLGWIALISSSACASQPDTRPETPDYIIEAILAPSCGRAACHSSETKVHNLAFDTIAAGRSAMLSTGKRNQRLVVPGMPTKSLLVTILSDTGKPMPPDAPLPDADIELITNWVAGGAVGLQ